MNEMDSDEAIEKLIQQYDNTAMPLPDIEFQPHILISKVRKHYMEHVIKLLALNYENNQKLLNKNIYLPSAIWRCAKSIEINAAQSSMVVQLYRKNIAPFINQLKNDTSRGKLNKMLLDCLQRPPQNEKKSQTTLTMGKECTCTCTCNQRKKVRKDKSPSSQNENVKNITLNKTSIENQNESIVSQPDVCSSISLNTSLHAPLISDADEVMLQLEKLFEGGNNDDDIFDGMFSNSVDVTFDESYKKSQNIPNEPKDAIIEEHAAQIKSLDERLASLSGVLVQNTTEMSKSEAVKTRKSSNKWLCEEYFLKTKLFELLDQLRDCNRAKLMRIKELLVDLFGDDSDDEGVVSPMEETPEFVTSCKERIAPWVVKLLTPYYSKGRIRGKALFKSLAKHLIRLIYQCSKYPEEYEVKDFIQDFLENHKMIRCEADFKKFRIDNI